MRGPEDATISSLSEYTEGALRNAVAEMQPGWMVLHECTLADNGEAATKLPYVLLHRNIGVALLSAEPDPAAVTRLQRRLDAVGFTSNFGGYPPIICRMLPPADLPLAEVLTAAFALAPPRTLWRGEMGGGDAPDALPNEST
jgi:hypothetical protein